MIIKNTSYDIKIRKECVIFDLRNKGCITVVTSFDNNICKSKVI